MRAMFSPQLSLNIHYLAFQRFFGVTGEFFFILNLNLFSSLFLLIHFLTCWNQPWVGMNSKFSVEKVLDQNSFSDLTCCEVLEKLLSTKNSSLFILEVEIHSFKKYFLEVCVYAIPYGQGRSLCSWNSESSGERQYVIKICRKILC